jgi:CRISPR-associated protein Cas2
MMVLVSYDVRTDVPEGATRLRRLAKICEDYGQRVQYSVFECVVDPAQWTMMRSKLEATIDPDYDSLPYYYPARSSM